MREALDARRLDFGRSPAAVAPVRPQVMGFDEAGIATAHRARREVGICGQAPSDYPEFAAFLVDQGIDSISLNPDAAMSTKFGACLRRSDALRP
jgi:phosphoenolpyruvate-protein kinase (PTS system EI component)